MATSSHMWIITRRFFVVTLLSVILSAQWVRASDDVQGKTCSNIDIRSDVKNFQKLNNCTVVEGFLRILLIDSGQPQDYYNLSFPRLTEITGYLLLYRVNGLVSLADMFPNLAVIRGNDLFHNSAIVIFEMPDLQEIGLKSLTDVLRGSVFILRNPNLCYLQTVDWSLILRADKERNMIRHNKDPEKCPDTCPSHCPEDFQCQNSSSISSRMDTSCVLCWNSHSCQKVCNEACRHQDLTCNKPSDCCHKECLGGCNGRTSSDCNACRHVLFNNTCVEKCPAGTYEFMGRRCLNEQECINAVANGPSKERKIIWKPILGQCVADCPPGYAPYESDPHRCYKCESVCPKKCFGELINNVATAQKFKGCTIIQGSLYIEINGAANIIKELEDNLQDIKVIEGSLKISRSFPLVSLNFLKNLEVIEGSTLERNEYALVVLYNENLQELWDWTNRSKNLTIKAGKIFFLFNPKLRYDKITDFYKRVYGEDKELPDRNDVSNTTNGDRVACRSPINSGDVSNLKLVLQPDAKAVVVSWESVSGNVEDRRSLLGYSIYYKEAPFKNVSIFDDKDVCDTKGWKVKDIAVQTKDEPTKLNWQNSTPRILDLILHLKPFTQYALFVQTFTTASERKGARSDIYYFKTLVYTPSQPTNVEAKALHSSNITINWKAPKQPRGIITHYAVTITEQKDPQDYTNQRDVCLDPRQESIKKLVITDTKELAKDGVYSVKNPKLEKEEEEIENIVINFEDFLHNNIYVKNPNRIPTPLLNTPKTKRSISEKMQSAQTTPLNTPSTLGTDEFDSVTQNVPNPASGTSTLSPVNVHQDNFTSQVRTFNITVSNKEETSEQFTKIVSGLKHFTEYSIEIRACHDDNVQRPKIKDYIQCSAQAIVNARTLPLGGADDISNSSVMVKTDNSFDGSVFVKWDEPISPNGLILSYQLKYGSVDEATVKVSQICVTQSQYAESRGYLLTEIAPGKYYLAIRATSLAGVGNWTTPIEFEIE